MNRFFSCFLLIWAVGAHGCSWLVERQESRHVATAQADDRACREAGYTWPGDAYRECRLFRADARRREDWQALQMTRQGQQADPAFEPLSTAAPYRPIRAGNFQCVAATSAAGEPFIDCREGDGQR